MKTLGSFHFVVLHFPLALLITAAGWELLRAAKGYHRLSDATAIMLTLGTLGAILTAPLGWLAAYPLPLGYMAWHRWLGTATPLAALLLLVAEPHLRYRAKVAGLVMLAGLVGLVGHLGGSQTHGPLWGQ